MRMCKFKRHIKRWNYWRKSNTNNKIHKLLVLLGIIKSPTFEVFLLPDELPNVNNMFYGEEMFSKETYEYLK